MLKKLLPVLVLFTFFLSACNVITSSTGTQPPPVVETQAPSAPGNEVLINIIGFKFDPKTITIKAGTTVTWTNKDSAIHNIVGDNNSFVSPDMLNGQKFSFTFNQAGTYNYICGVHPAMKGTMIVE